MLPSYAPAASRSLPRAPDYAVERLLGAQPAATTFPSAAATASQGLLWLSAGAAFPPCLPNPLVLPAQPAESVASCGAPAAANERAAWAADASGHSAAGASGRPRGPTLLLSPPAHERRGTKRPLELQHSAGISDVAVPPAAPRRPMVVLVLPARVAAAMAAAAARGGPEGSGDNFSSEADSRHARGRQLPRRTAELLAAAAYRRAFEAAEAQAALALQAG